MCYAAQQAIYLCLRGEMIGDDVMVPTKSAAPRAATSWGRVIGTILLMLAIIGSISYGAFFVAAPFGWLRTPEQRLTVFLSGAIVGELVALGVLTLLLRRQDLTLGELGLGTPTSWQGVALGLLVALAIIGVTLLNPAVGPNVLRFSLLKVLALVAALVAGVVEEVIFRGYLMTSVARMGKGRVTQVVLSGVLFALAHLYGIGSPLALLTTWGSTLVLGLGLAVTYLVGKRSLTPVIIGHALVDAIIEPWLLLGFFTGTL